MIISNQNRKNIIELPNIEKKNRIYIQFSTPQVFF